MVPPLFWNKKTAMESDLCSTHQLLSALGGDIDYPMVTEDAGFPLHLAIALAAAGYAETTFLYYPLDKGGWGIIVP